MTIMAPSSVPAVELLFINFPVGVAPSAGRAVFPHRPGQTVKHLSEKAGVPHTEIGRVENGEIGDGGVAGPECMTQPGDGGGAGPGHVHKIGDGGRAGGGPAGPGYIPRPGETVLLHPADRRIGPEDPAPRFLLDVHPGKLARHLRLLGFDALYRNDSSDAEIVRRAAAEGRVILSRDRGILSRQAVGAGCLVRSGDPFRQAVDVVLDFGLAGNLRPFSRCARCGALLVPVDKKAVADGLPDLVRRRYRRFLRCPACGQVYWRGDHFRNIEALLRRLRAEAGARGNGRAAGKAGDGGSAYKA